MIELNLLELALLLLLASLNSTPRGRSASASCEITFCFARLQPNMSMLTFTLKLTVQLWTICLKYSTFKNCLQHGVRGIGVVRKENAG